MNATPKFTRKVEEYIQAAASLATEDKHSVLTPWHLAAGVFEVRALCDCRACLLEMLLITLCHELVALAWIVQPPNKWLAAAAAAAAAALSPRPHTHIDAIPHLPLPQPPKTHKQTHY